MAVRCALLLVHGILGAPEYFDFLLPCVEAGWRIEPLLLEGHGSTVVAFGSASMEHWKRQVCDAVDRLRAEGYDTIVIAAHSMGTLFALDQAFQGRAEALFLLNPPLRLRVTPKLLLNPVKMKLRLSNSPDVIAAREAYSIADDSNPLHYIGWLPRYMELFREISRMRSVIRTQRWPDIPMAVAISRHDEMVSPSVERFFQGRPRAELLTLSHSSHYHYLPADKQQIIHSFSRLLASFRSVGLAEST